jgi:hypothetical protein
MVNSWQSPLRNFISDPTILHADDGSPHDDWIFERT